MLAYNLNPHISILNMYIGFLGLLCGSLYNVIIYRLPRILEHQEFVYMQSLMGKQISSSETFNLFFPGSHCPHCKHIIKFYELVPVLSYLLLKGQCARCKTKISWQYLLVEIATGLLFFIASLHFKMGLSLLAALIFISSMICLGIIDWKHQLLPDKLVFPTLFLGLFFNTQTLFCSIHDALLGTIGGYLILWITAVCFKKIRHKEGLGEGDMKMMALFGAYFGIDALSSLILIAVGVFFGIYLFTKYKKGISLDTPLPFGPALAIAGLIFLFFGSILQFSSLVVR